MAVRGFLALVEQTRLVPIMALPPQLQTFQFKVVEPEVAAAALQPEPQGVLPSLEQALVAVGAGKTQTQSTPTAALAAHPETFPVALLA